MSLLRRLRMTMARMTMTILNPMFLQTFRIQMKNLMKMMMMI